MSKFNLNYEDTEKSVELEIYGLKFEIDSINLEKLQNVDRKDKNAVDEILKIVLGNDCIDRINKKRKEDGYNELNLKIELKILGFIMEKYAEAMSEDTETTVKGMMGLIEKYNVNNNYNREQRRAYSKQNRYNNQGYYGRNKRY